MIRCMMIIVLLAVVSGCGALSEESQAIDPPPENWRAEVLSKTWMEEQVQEDLAAVVLYAKDTLGYVVPYQADIPIEGGEVIQKTVEHMIAGGPGESLLPDGFSMLLPAGTEVKGLTINSEKKMAIVDFSKEFSTYSAAQERKMLEALTWALTEFDEIDQVQLQLEGTPIQKMPVAGWPLSAPLNRVMGINVEREHGVHLARSMPMMLYFQNTTVDDQPYYVPITRMVDLTRHAERGSALWEASAVMEQLIKGPATGSRLQPIFPPETVGRLDQVQVMAEGNNIAVFFPDELLMGGKTIPMEIITPIMHSMKENLQTYEVSIGVEDAVHETSNETDDTAILNPFPL